MINLACALAIVVAVLGVATLLPYLRKYNYFIQDKHTQPDVTQIMWIIGLQGALGFGVSCTALLILGCVGFISQLELIGFTSVFAILFIVQKLSSTLSHKKQAYSDASTNIQPPASRKNLLSLLSIHNLALVIFSAGVIVLLWVTMVPVIEIDDITYHLSVPKAYFNEGKIFPIPLNAHSNWTLLSEMSYLWAFGLHPQSVITPKLLELIRCILLAMLVAGFSGWLYKKKVGLVCGTLVLLFEEISRWGTLSHTDAGQALFLFAGIALIGKWFHHSATIHQSPATSHQQPVMLIYGSMLLGFGVAVKFTAGAIFSATVVSWLLTRLLYRGFAPQHKLSLPQLLKEMILLLFPALLVLSPWLIKNAIITGDPFYPFLYSIFPIKEDFLIPLNDFLKSAVHFDRYFDFSELNLKQFITHLHIIVSNARITNVNGFLFLFPLGVLFLILNKEFRVSVRQDANAMTTPDSPIKLIIREKEQSITSSSQHLTDYNATKIFLVLTTLFTIPFFLRSPYWRFFIGIYPVAIILFVGEVYLFLSSGKIRWLAEVFCAALLIYFSLHFVGYNRFNRPHFRIAELPPYYPTLTPSAEQYYYERFQPSIKIIRRVNATLSPRDRLLASYTHQTLPLLSVRFIPNAPMTSREAITTLVAQGKTAEEIAQWMNKYHITHILTEESLDSGTAKTFQNNYLKLLWQDPNSPAKLYWFKGY
ncbi:hypothetical protein J7M23_04990 [Candidatus Sumerlaeota bacterium]|nr:hypothetical protein [Candidatus Sumerlaeota bacterium]